MGARLDATMQTDDDDSVDYLGYGHWGEPPQPRKSRWQRLADWLRSAWRRATP